MAKLGPPVGPRPAPGRRSAGSRHSSRSPGLSDAVVYVYQPPFGSEAWRRSPPLSAPPEGTLVYFLSISPTDATLPPLALHSFSVISSQPFPLQEF